MDVKTKRIALVAHDHQKPVLLNWVAAHRDVLKHHTLFATGTTGRLIHDQLKLEVTALESGPLGGDLEVGAMIARGQVDMLIFFWDPLESQPHDPDVKALLRIAVVWNVPVACNLASADFLMTSPHFNGAYTRIVPDFSQYRRRLKDVVS